MRGLRGRLTALAVVLIATVGCAHYYRGDLRATEAQAPGFDVRYQGLEPKAFGKASYEGVPLDRSRTLFLRVPTFEEDHRQIHLGLLLIQLATRRFKGDLIFHCRFDPPTEVRIFAISIADSNDTWKNEISRVQLYNCEPSLDRSKSCPPIEMNLPVWIGGEAGPCRNKPSLGIPTFEIPRGAKAFTLKMTYLMPSQDSEEHTVSIDLIRHKGGGIGLLMD